MLKILRTVKSLLDSLERFILNRRNRELTPLSVKDLKGAIELSNVLERNAQAIQQFYSEFSRILENAYYRKDNEMSS